MKRRPFEFSTEAAMQLLVDPMCNFFAGLVFVSVLVAVFASQEPQSPWREEEPGRTFANQELLVARLGQVREELADLQRQNQALAGKLGSDRPLPSLRAVEKALAEATGGEGAAGGLDSPETRARLEGALIRERDRLRSRRETLGNEIISLNEETARLRGRLERLPRGGGGKEEVRVRLPLARSASQNPLYIMISGGKYYPLQDAAGREDETHVVRERTVAADEVRPRVGKGFQSGEAMRKFFEQMDSKRQYPVLVVYADSFAEYQALRQILEMREQAYGFEPRPVGSAFRLSAQGHKPEVQ